MNVNVWDVIDRIQRLTRERVAVITALAHPDFPLETLTPTKKGSTS